MQNRIGKRKNKAFVAGEKSFKKHAVFCEQKENHLHGTDSINKRYFYENNVTKITLNH
jgi:hypothetical protein